MLRCIDSPPVHAFDFTPAVSSAKRYAWVNDQFGVSWQLRLAHLTSAPG